MNTLNKFFRKQTYMFLQNAVKTLHDDVFLILFEIIIYSLIISDKNF